MNGFLNFDKMISTSLIKIVFWIGAGISALIGFGTTMSGLFGLLTGHGIAAALSAFVGLLFMIIGPLAIRIVCESAIVLFLIHDDIAVLRKSSVGLSSNVQPTVQSYSPQYVQPL